MVGIQVFQHGRADEAAAHIRPLEELFAAGFEPVMPMRVSVTQRAFPETGQWSQWEAIWCRTE